MLAKLLDRFWHVAILLETYRLALAQVHRSLFPLNEQPQGLASLIERFRQGKAIKKFVWDQLIGGANVALTFVRTHYPNLDWKRIARGPALLPSGGPMPMEEHYKATRLDALVLVHHVLKEEESWVEPKEEEED